MPEPVSEAAVDEALDRIDSAWHTRHGGFRVPPGFAEDVRRVIAGVRADLAS